MTKLEELARNIETALKPLLDAAADVVDTDGDISSYVDALREQLSQWRKP